MVMKASCRRFVRSQSSIMSCMLFVCHVVLAFLLIAAHRPSLAHPSPQYNHVYYGRPRDQRCPAINDRPLICPQHGRSCSLAKLDGCNQDGMYCCEDKCNNAACYDRNGHMIHIDVYRQYDYSQSSPRQFSSSSGGGSSIIDGSGAATMAYKARMRRGFREKAKRKAQQNVGQTLDD